MSDRGKDKIADITFLLLDGILRASEATIGAFVNQRSLRKKLTNDEFTSRQIADRVRELIKAGCVETQEENGSVSIRLTRKGKIKHLEKSPNSTRDGKWRIISFDIPEELKTLRIKFTRSLRRIGYKSVQKSLWVCPCSKADQISLLINELNLAKYVAYFVVEKTDIQSHLEKIFED